MNKFIILFWCCLLLFPQTKGQESKESLNDGPYIFRSGNAFNAIWISEGERKKGKITRRSFADFQNEFRLPFDYHDLVAVNFIKPYYEQVFTKVDSVVAISDIHGSFNGYISLLKSNGVIDDNLDWSFGRGHLVVLGDIFDRGEQVTEVLWHLFALETQAAKAGGKVHVILGNHELMTFAGDLLYINPKYLHVAKAAGIKYQELYSDKSVIGTWLRYKPVMAIIDSVLFVHAGISRELMERGISVADINRLFVQMLVEKAVGSQKDIQNLIFLTEDKGPVQYRGFFEDRTFTENTADSILRHYGVKSIVVGHTASEGIRPLFNNKILGIDAGLGENRSGAVLIIRGDSFYRGTTDGKRQKL